MKSKNYSNKGLELHGSVSKYIYSDELIVRLDNTKKMSKIHEY